MQHLPLANPGHRQLEAAFKAWLQGQGYAPDSIYQMPRYIRDFLHWLEQQDQTLEQLRPAGITRYFNQLQQRPNQRRGGFLAQSYLHKHRQALRKFSEYLNKTGRPMAMIDLHLPPPTPRTPPSLSRQQIRALYRAAGDNSPLGLRDRAMLALYYGCGLRRNEGVQLNTHDILINRRLLYVKAGKMRERYVPMSHAVIKDLDTYLKHGRPHQLKDLSDPALLISLRGCRTGGYNLYCRLKRLARLAGLETPPGLHSLRHAVATHLLQSGMALEQIARFLGHHSLESTQRYTHLAREQQNPYENL